MQNRCSDTEETTVQSLVSSIKKELRANMNGIASAAMRQTDDYRVNWGVELPRLQTIADEFGKNHELAQALWKESVRECKILATMIQPIDSFFEEIAEIWVESIRTVEIAQTTSINLLQYLPYASNKAFQWIASDNEIEQICGFSTIYHLIRKNKLQQRSADELLDQANAINETACIALRRLASNIVALLEEQNGEEQKQEA